MKMEQKKMNNEWPGEIVNLTRGLFHLLVLDEVVPAQRKQNPTVERPLKEKMDNYKPPQIDSWLSPPNSFKASSP